MDKLKKYNLGLFLTEKMSLKNWDRSGILKREIAPYNLLAKHFNKIYLFTYDDKNELSYKKFLAPNIEIVYKNVRMRAKDYRWLLPFIHIKKIYKCHAFKTNQLKSRAALIAKLLKPTSKLILRTGWTVSLFEKQRLGKSNSQTKFWEKVAYKLCDIGIVTSRGDKEYLYNEYDIKPEKIKVLPNYIDTDKFKPIKSTKYENKIIFIGRIDKQKNLENLFKALKNTNIELDIVGEESIKTSGVNYKKHLTNLAKDLNIKVGWLGKIDNDQIPQILNKYKIFILSSLYEGMPKSLLEAMSCGLACIGTDVPGTKEIMQNDSTGLLSDIDEKSIKSNILKLINNKQLQIKLGNNARQFILDNYSLQNQIKKEISIYENLI